MARATDVSKTVMERLPDLEARLDNCRRCGAPIWANPDETDPICQGHIRLRDFGVLPWLAIVSLLGVLLAPAIARLL